MAPIPGPVLCYTAEVSSGDAPPFDTLLRCLELEPLDRDLYLGDPGPGEGRLYGGMVAAQSVMAGYRTLEVPRPIHSLHAYFLRPGRHDLPLRFVVDRIRDGRSYTTRRVVAHQGGEAIFSMQASFTAPEPGLSHQDPMPEVPQPESLEEWDSTAPKALPLGGELTLHRAISEIRLCEPWDLTSARGDGGPRQHCWTRVLGELPDDPQIHSALLVYLTDRMLLSTAARAHRVPPGDSMGASLDHSVWFHRPVHLDRSWMLYASESPAAHAARAIVFGGLHRHDGVRLASVAQEALIRTRRS